MIQFTVAIMAGGRSARMGQDKAFVRLAGRPLIAHLLAAVSGLGQDETIVITNRPADYAHLGLSTHADALPGKGPLGGIYTAITRSRSPYTLVLACDMPFVQPALLRHMIGFCADDAFDVIVPRVDGYPEGLHAIYGQSCAEPIRRRLDADQLKVISFYDDVRVRYLDEPERRPFDPTGLSFINLNTPDELDAARRLSNEDG